MNGMFFDRGSASDYDAWVALGTQFGSSPTSYPTSKNP
jgi:hypothetical protein